MRFMRLERNVLIPMSLINWSQINIVLARRQTPTHLVSPGNQPCPLLRQIVLVRLNAHPAQIQSVAIPARLNGGAGVHISPAVVRPPSSHAIAPEPSAPARDRHPC